MSRVDLGEDVDRREHLQTLERGLSVLLAFTDSGPSMTLGTLAAATGLTKPTVRRVVLTLEHLGYARSVGTGYVLTPKVLSLGYSYLSSVNLTALAQAPMEALTDELGLGSSLAALDGGDIVYLHRVQRHRITSINLAVGTRLPAHATSMGHVLLSGLSPESLNVYLRCTELVALTEHTITDADELRARLQRINERGWDVVDQELEIGRRSAAAPIMDAGGRVVAALSLSCGTSQKAVTEITETLVPPLVQTAGQISALIGGSVYDTRTGSRTTERSPSAGAL